MILREMSNRYDVVERKDEQIHRLTKVSVETVKDGQPIVFAEAPFLQNNKDSQMRTCDRIGMWNVDLKSLGQLHAVG